MKLEGGSRQWLIIHRFKCCSCGRLHNELPDCLVPYKHYQTEIISGVLDGVCTPDDLECEDYPCADTMLLWLKWFSLNLQRIEGFLRRALYKVSCIKEGFSHDRTSLLETARKNTKRCSNRLSAPFITAAAGWFRSPGVYNAPTFHSLSKPNAV